MGYVLFVAFAFAILMSESAKGEMLHLSKRNRCGEAKSEIEVKTVSSICARGKYYQITYDRKLARIILIIGKRRVTLHEIPIRYDPSLVGAEAIIGFLPDSLQVYKQSDMLMYISAIRTTGGDGRGRCGAGSEIHLNLLKIREHVPLGKSKILIGSCEESIELVGQDISTGTLGKILLENGKLSLHFLNYKGSENSPVGVVTSDFKQLIFQSNGSEISQ